MFEELTNTQIIGLLGKNFKHYRLNQQLTQKELAGKTNISVATIHHFEAGTINNLTLSNLITLMRHIGLIRNLETIIPEQPESPYAKIKTRIRHASK